MLDEKDLQAIAAMLAEERKHTEALFAEERKHTDEKFETFRMDFIAYIEAHIDPQIKTLAEAHSSILEKLTPISRIEALEVDNFAMKTAIANLNARLSALEKAQ